MAYVVATEEDSTYYDLYIQADGTIKANEDMSYWFSGFSSLEEMNGVELLDVSDVTNMNRMFRGSGFRSTIFELDLSGLDTSKVTDMSEMFSMSGVTAQSYSLNLSDWDTSNVTNMDSMFLSAGSYSETFVLDLSGWDTGGVTNMSNMFDAAGYETSSFSLNVSLFDTSNVTDMSEMFYSTGCNSTDFITSITISNSNVLDYTSMFLDVATKGESKITVNYTSETSDLVDQMIATKSSNSNVVKGNLIMNFDNLNKGDEVTIGSEKFNVISQTDDTITLLAKYNIGADFYQSSTLNPVAYSTGWDHEYFSVEGGDTNSVDLKNYGTIVYDLSYSYASLISEILGKHTVTSTILDYYHLKDLGCEYSSNFMSSEIVSCTNASYSNILNNGQMTWTAMVSAEPFGNAYPIYLDDAGEIAHQSYTSTAGVRPVITISKNPNLENNIKSFKISDKVYRMYDGMTWEEWIDSDFNENEFKIGNCYCDVGCNSDGDLDGYLMYSVKNNTLTIAYPGQGNVPFINAIDPSLNYVLEMWDTNSNNCGDI